MLKRLLFVVLMAFACSALAAVKAFPWGPKPQFMDSSGAPMSSGTLTFYGAGSSTPQNTYTTQAGSVANSNPITLNSRGETPSEVWLTEGLSYKVVLKDSSGSTIWTVDNVSGINDSTVTAVDEWKASGLTPTYVSATSLTFAGDQTVIFHPGRRVKTTNSGGTIYSTITTSTFSAGVTTLKVVNDTGVLDSGLSAVSYGLVSTANTSLPAFRYGEPGTAATGTIPRPIASKLNDHPVSTKDFGAICDGTTHPLSDYYGTLAAAQTVYPHATALTNELDWAAIQAALNLSSGRDVWIPAGTCLINVSIAMPNRYGMVLRGEYQFSILKATAAVSIISFAAGSTRQYTTIDGITFKASGAGAGAATGIAGNAGLSYVMEIDVQRCLFSGTLRYGVTGNFLVARFIRNSFGSDTTASGTFKAMKLYGTDTFQTTILLDSNQINSANDDYAVEIQWAYDVQFTGINDFEGNPVTAGVIKLTDVFMAKIGNGFWGERNGAGCPSACSSGLPLVKTYDGANAGDMRVEFDGIHYEGFASGANDVLLDNTNAAAKLYKLTNSWLQDVTKISKDGASYDVQTESMMISNNKAAGVTPSWIDANAFRGTITNDEPPTGYVGEYQSCIRPIGSATALTTATAINVCSISLAPGDYDVGGEVDFTGNAATTVNKVLGSISTTSATSGGLGQTVTVVYSGATIFNIANVAHAVPQARLKLSAASTTVYLVAIADFAVNTASGAGFMWVRRRR